MMSMDKRFRQIERKVFSASFDDGLLDFSLASLLLLLVGAPFLSGPLGDFWSSMIFLPFWGIIYLFLRWLRKTRTGPRMGTVTFSLERRQALRTFTIVMVLINLLAIAFGIFTLLAPALPVWLIGLRSSVIALVFLGVAAAFLDQPHLFAYGLLLAVALPLGEWLSASFGLSHHGIPHAVGAVIIVILARGILKYYALMRSPLPYTDIDN